MIVDSIKNAITSCDIFQFFPFMFVSKLVWYYFLLLVVTEKMK